MGSQRPLSFALLAFLTLLSSQEMLSGLEASNKESTRVYIVYLGEKKHEDPDLVTASHHEMLASLLGSKEEALQSIVYSYRHGFSGFAAMLTESQAKNIAELPEVVSVMPNRVHRIQTTRSWDYLGLHYYQPTGLLPKAKYGDGVIIGVIDSGIWPESRSFSDHGYGPIPSRWKGKCAVEPTFGANNCSRKIIGARYYARGVKAEDLVGEYMSPRDFNTHGTHTASTAAGVPVDSVSFHGLGAGMVRGGAPRARLAIYKACWGQAGQCSDSTVLKAFDDAIHDGVDVISLSLHGDGYPAGSLPAVMKGITVAFIAGNQGPVPQTVNNDVPWVITVAASSIDRSFPTVITLGNNQKLVGQGAFYKPDKDHQFKELVYGESCDEESLNGTHVDGKFVLCFDPQNVPSTIPREVISTAIETVLNAQGKGVIFAHYTSFLMDYLLSYQGLPCIAVDLAIGQQIKDYMDSVRKPMVKVEPTRSVVGQVQSPNVASFSSRGPSISYPELIKPDIAAPGTNILAAVGDSYGFDTGTSMACPHVAGIAALLKSSHPDWSPAAIKSAIITTASVTDGYGQPIVAEGVPRKLADPFDYGGGQINPNKAMDPGLVYDINPKEYLEFFNCRFGLHGGCNTKQRPLYHLNLPSIAIPNLRKTVMVQRTVTNVGKVDAVYKAALEIPPGIKMVVEPSVLVFNARSKVRTFTVTFTPTHKKQGVYGFGSLTWHDGSHSVRSPIAVRTTIQDFYADTF
ncbi:subtilisin-like protease SBT3.3 [Phoenix dactylifera]|uniref:Subtilisin-like protease SBT3.3 n=1 Tax=Phoenix dactylifera TaxID=42345 RepID=A0A8B7BQY7_PHODC|nr:subtilisin-like protease SBT3.3 [Phoenix dactylifera]